MTNARKNSELKAPKGKKYRVADPVEERRKKLAKLDFRELEKYFGQIVDDLTFNGKVMPCDDILIAAKLHDLSGDLLNMDALTDEIWRAAGYMAMFQTAYRADKAIPGHSDLLSGYMSEAATRLGHYYENTDNYELKISIFGFLMKHVRYRRAQIMVLSTILGFYDELDESCRKTVDVAISVCTEKMMKTEDEDVETLAISLRLNLLLAQDSKEDYVNQMVFYAAKHPRIAERLINELIESKRYDMADDVLDTILWKMDLKFSEETLLHYRFVINQKLNNSDKCIRAAYDLIRLCSADFIEALKYIHERMTDDEWEKFIEVDLYKLISGNEGNLVKNFNNSDQCFYYLYFAEHYGNYLLTDLIYGNLLQNCSQLRLTKFYFEEIAWLIEQPDVRATDIYMKLLRKLQYSGFERKVKNFVRKILTNEEYAKDEHLVANIKSL